MSRETCNALLIGIPRRSLQKLLHIQNSAARVLIKAQKYEHITPILQTLRWLPSTYPRVHPWKRTTISKRTPHTPIHSKTPPLHKYPPSRPLQDQTPYYGDQAFTAAAPRLWNTLPDKLRAPQTVDSFKTQLEKLMCCLCLMYILCQFLLCFM